MQAPQQAKIVVDGYTRFCLTAIVVLLTVLMIGLWADGPALSARTDAAPVPKTDTMDKKFNLNAGGQRVAIADAVKDGNKKLDRVIQLLESGKIQVIVGNLEAGDENQKARKLPGQ